MHTGMRAPSKSLFSRIVTRPRPARVITGISLSLFLAPVVFAHLDGSWNAFLFEGLWRPLLVPSIVIVYILVAAQLMARSESRALTALRPVILLSDAEFDSVVRQGSRTSLSGELLAFGAGAIFGFWLGSYWLVKANTLWLQAYGPLSQSLMMGLLAWTIYEAVSSTRLVAELHRQPLQVDLLDIKPFEPMGRQSLVVALVFAGGILLGALFGLDVRNIYSLMVNVPLMSVPFLVFFLSMRHTHRVLAVEKKRQLQAVAQKITHASRALQPLVTSGESLGGLAAEYTALIAYEAHLRAAPTWPYNTAMLRTIFLSVLAPVLLQVLSVLLFGS